MLLVGATANNNIIWCESVSVVDRQGQKRVFCSVCRVSGRDDVGVVNSLFVKRQKCRLVEVVA